ncbi:bromodomain-containing protein 8 [Elysia marginata]|uniref:Bromodomain-containing protein 8 n=1 Tax=Elysia marginata TaxID=1093978 RepID=A0AAV4EZV7_9GAST|nr:bromodomain-containing protein 8 [Elysia marginata]
MASSSSASAAARLKPKKPLDVWSTREKLCLASAVFKIGDQNWVSVSRAIKPYADPNRPPEWFHQKNCLLQYYDMMEQLEQPKRKRGGDKSETDTQSLQIMRKMTIERSEQLKKEMMEMQQEFKNLKAECEEINAGLWDDRIKDVWQDIQKEEKAAEELAKTNIKMEVDAGQNTPERSDSMVFLGDVEDNTQSSVGENVDISVLTDEEGTQSSSATTFLTSTPIVTSADLANKLPAASHLLSSLLQSDVKTATGLQQLKQEHEQEQSHGPQQSILAQASRSLLKTPVTQDDPLTSPPSSSKSQVTTLATTSASVDSPATSLPQGEDEYQNLIEETVITDILETVPTDIPSVTSTPEVVPSVATSEDSNVMPVVEGIQEEVVEEEIVVKEEVIQINDEQSKAGTSEIEEDTPVAAKDDAEKEAQDKDEVSSLRRGVDAALATETDPAESSMKDEPLSPTSSISSRVSESGSKRGHRTRGRPRAPRSARQGTRKSLTTDDDKKDDGGSSRHSDVELSEDEVRESADILSGQLTSVNASSILSESFPNSPASMSMGSDTEEEKSFKQWKKSIMLVWRAAATHKYANVFLHPVTNDIAPGYHSVVLRPMDLSTIKKNVETGVIRTTVDFQRDMMLMFTNAIMYNSSDHNVFKMAKEMYDDVMQHLEQYVNTQMMMQTTDGKNLRQSRRPDTSDKEDEQKKRRASVDISESGGKAKKRKTRLDE